MSTVSGNSKRSHKRGRPTVLSPAVANRAVYLYRRGESTTAIAKRFGVGVETVRRALVTAGVKMRGRGRPGRPVDPIWGRLAFLMYTPRSPDEMRDDPQPGHVRLNLGGRRELSRTSTRNSP